MSTINRIASPQPLDLERPLWQLYLVEGLEGGRHAYISKTHHALVDGVSAVDVGTIMLDPNPEGTEMPIPEERWDPLFDAIERELRPTNFHDDHWVVDYWRLRLVAWK